MKTALRTILILPCLFLASEGRMCSPAPEYPNVRLMRANDETAFYKCPAGQESYGGKPLIRCVDGRWSELTLQCQKKPCGNAGELRNGHVKYEGEAVLGDKAFVFCDDGYMLKGPKYIVCKSTGWSSELPTCEEGEVTCSPPKVANSVKMEGALVYKVSDVLTVSCSQGFQLNGTGRLTCGSDGQWKPRPPRCMSNPEKNNRCSVPVNTLDSHANLATKYLTSKSFADGAKVYYVCDVGYVHGRGSKYRRCFKGQWSPLQLKCRPKLCGSVGELLNGHYEYSGVEFGDTATAVCDVGYQLVGRGRRNCLSRGWDGHDPVCEALACDEPPEVKNAEMIGYVEAPYLYRTVVSYRCLVGSHVGPSAIWCKDTGTWSTPLPQCRDVTCPSPNVPNASWVRSRTGHYRYRDSIYIQCNARFTIVGQSTITCGEDGQWSPELPKCKSTAWNAYRRG